MKKTGLFKIITIVLLVVMVLTWIFSASYLPNGTEIAEMGFEYKIGFFDFFQLLFGAYSFPYFIQIALLILSVGALYEVLGKTGKYRAWVEKIAAKLKRKELIFLIVSSFVIAILTSVFDFGFSLFIFLPFIISIILAIGYDKITACLATFGSMLIGTIGSTIGYNTTGLINKILGVELNNAITFKIVLFVLSFAALLFFLCAAKRSKSANKEDLDLLLGEKNSTKHSIIPIIIIFILLFVLLVLGCTNWESTFGITAFNDLNTTITEFSPKLPFFHITTNGVEYGMEETAIFASIFGKSVAAFGSWGYGEMTVIILIATIVLGLCYGMKLKGTFENMFEGAKKLLVPAALVVLTYAVVYFSGNTMFYTTLENTILSLTSKFKVVSILTSTISISLGSLLNVDMVYFVNYVLPLVMNTLNNNVVTAIISQGIYGVTMLIAPTSAILVLGLSYLNIPYKEWIKKIWKLVLILLAVVLIVSILALYIKL